MFTCPSCLNNQAAARKVIQSSETSDASSIPEIGDLKKYLVTTSELIPSIIKIVIMPAIKASMSIILSKIPLIVFKNCIVAP
jgi:hypothetical protein